MHFLELTEGFVSGGIVLSIVWLHNKGKLPAVVEKIGLILLTLLSAGLSGGFGYGAGVYFFSERYTKSLMLAGVALIFLAFSLMMLRNFLMIIGKSKVKNTFTFIVSIFSFLAFGSLLAAAIIEPFRQPVLVVVGCLLLMWMQIKTMRSIWNQRKKS